MAEKEKKDWGSIKYKIFDGTDNIFDERGSMFLAMRKVAWYSEGKDVPTEDKAKWELRKWTANETSLDQPGKGFTFLTENGPHDLAKMLVHNGYGQTKEILQELLVRDDFEESVKHVYDEASEGDDYFDAREELLSN